MNKPEFDDIYMDLAINLSKKSHCVKAHVGAVLTKDTRIISVGYNGPPAGTHNCDEVWPEVGCPRDSKNSCSLALHAEQNAIGEHRAPGPIDCSKQAVLIVLHF